MISLRKISYLVVQETVINPFLGQALDFFGTVSEPLFDQDSALFFGNKGDLPAREINLAYEGRKTTYEILEVFLVAGLGGDDIPNIVGTRFNCRVFD